MTRGLGKEIANSQVISNRSNAYFLDGGMTLL